MQTHYIFIDYENVQPGNIGLLTQTSYKTKIKIKIKVFLGRHQSMVPLSLVRALHLLGEDAEYIQLDSARRNAVDFNIAFQLGELANQYPEARFSILSNDAGYNAIVDGLRSKGITCARFADIESLLVESTAPLMTVQDLAQKNKVVAIMEGLNNAQNLSPKTIN